MTAPKAEPKERKAAFSFAVAGRIALALGLLALGAWQCKLAADIVIGERHWKRSRDIARAASPNSRDREIELRRGLESLPDHPEMQRDLATLLCGIENEKVASGRIASLSLENITEGLDLLEKAEQTFSARYYVTRTRGESALAFGEIHKLLGNQAEAEKWDRVALSDLIRTSDFLPLPRAAPDRLNDDIVRAAQAVGRDDIATQYLARMDVLQQREILSANRREAAAARSWLLMGNRSRMLRELRLGLWSRPEDERLLRLLEAAAADDHLRPAALATLAELRRQDRLGPIGVNLLRTLAAPSPVSTEAAADPSF